MNRLRQIVVHTKAIVGAARRRALTRSFFSFHAAGIWRAILNR
jgi:hypothetical protein